MPDLRAGGLWETIGIQQRADCSIVSRQQSLLRLVCRWRFLMLSKLLSE